MKIKVTIPLSLEVEVDLSPLADKVKLDKVKLDELAKVAETAADLLVATIGLSSSHAVTDSVHLDGFGKVLVTYDVSDSYLAGTPKASQVSK